MKAKVFIPLLILIIVVAAGVAWYFFPTSERASAPTKRTTIKSSPKVTQTSKADFEGQVVKSGNKKFSLTIPDGWKTVVNCDDSDLMFVSDTDQTRLEYVAGTAPVIEESSCGDDGWKVFFVAANKKSDSEPAKSEASAFHTSDGLKGTRLCEDNVTTSGLSEKTFFQQCTYRFEKGDTVYTLTYTRPDKSYLDRTELIDRVVKSFVISP